MRVWLGQIGLSVIRRRCSRRRSRQICPIQTCTMPFGGIWGGARRFGCRSALTHLLIGWRKWEGESRDLLGRVTNSAFLLSSSLFQMPFAECESGSSVYFTREMVSPVTGLKFFLCFPLSNLGNPLPLPPRIITDSYQSHPNPSLPITSHHPPTSNPTTSSLLPAAPIVSVHHLLSATSPTLAPQRLTSTTSTAGMTIWEGVCRIATPTSPRSKGSWTNGRDLCPLSPPGSRVKKRDRRKPPATRCLSALSCSRVSFFLTFFIFYLKHFRVSVVTRLIRHILYLATLERFMIRDDYLTYRRVWTVCVSHHWRASLSCFQ